MLDYFEAKWSTERAGYLYCKKNRSIIVDNLESKALYVNPPVIARLALNLKASVKKLWTKYGSSVHIGYQHFTTQKYISANCNYTNGNNDISNLDILNGLRCKNFNCIGHLNYNSLRNKFEIIVSLIAVYLDILMISDTKLENLFLNS